MTTSLAGALAAGRPLTALIAKMPCVAHVESAGHAGFDLVVLDTEHGPAGGTELEAHLIAAQAAALPALVRLPSEAPAGVLAALDAGAAGVIVPHVLDAQQATRVVAAAHYPPRGHRGLATSTRAGRYGSVPLAEHLRRAAEETVVLAQVEDAEAVPRTAEIAQVEGISGIFLGTADLAMSLGHPGDLAHPVVRGAIDEVVAATQAARAPLVVVASSGAEARAWAGRGATVTTVVSTQLVMQAFAQAVQAVRPAPAAAGREPLLLLPGMLAGPSSWARVAERLAAHAEVRVGRIDLDGDVGEMAATVLATAPDRFALAGHSLGAHVALEIVRRAPGRVTRLALLNASARAGDEAQLSHWAALADRLQAGGFPEIVREHARTGTADSGPELVEALEASARAVGALGLGRQLQAQVTRPDFRPHLAAIRVPTLVVSGAADTVAPPEAQLEVLDAVPGAEHATVPDAGHHSPLERPEAVSAILRGWLGR